MRSATPTASGEIRKFSVDTATEWMHWSGVALADVANEDDDEVMKFGAVGFTRAPRGAESTFEFAYDEVLVVTAGRCTVRGRNGDLTAGPGEVDREAKADLLDDASTAGRERSR